MRAHGFRSVYPLALVLALGATSSLGQTFNGFDNNASGDPALAPRTNSDIAKDAFVSAAGGVGVLRSNDFEALSAGAVPATLDFGGGLTASFTGLATMGTAITAGVGSYFEFPISGSKHLTALTVQSTSYWSMAFSQPLTAIGFYATDPSDWLGTSVPNPPPVIPPLRVVLTGAGGAVSYDLTPGRDPLTIANASVAFFGVVDPGNPFTQITLLHPAHALTEDAVGIDNLMAVAVPEPETWVSMLLGMGLLGWRLRERMRQA